MGKTNVTPAVVTPYGVKPMGCCEQIDPKFLPVADDPNNALTVTDEGLFVPDDGIVGPAGNYATIPEFSKWFLSFIMLVGRLELFTVFLLFTPTFWKK